MSAKIVRVYLNTRVWRTEEFNIHCQDEKETSLVIEKLLQNVDNLWDLNYELKDSEDWDTQTESCSKIEVYDA